MPMYGVWEIKSDGQSDWIQDFISLSIFLFLIMPLLVNKKSNRDFGDHFQYFLDTLFLYDTTLFLLFLRND